MMPRKDNLEALQDRLTKAEAIVSLAVKHKQAIQRGWDDTHYNEMMMTDREINRLKKELWEQLDEYVREFPEVS